MHRHPQARGEGRSVDQIVMHSTAPRHGVAMLLETSRCHFSSLTCRLSSVSLPSASLSRVITNRTNTRGTWAHPSRSSLLASALLAFDPLCSLLASTLLAFDPLCSLAGAKSGGEQFWGRWRVPPKKPSQPISQPITVKTLDPNLVRNFSRTDRTKKRNHARCAPASHRTGGLIYWRRSC